MKKLILSLSVLLLWMGALFSIALNPLLFRLARTLEQRTRVPAVEGGVASAQT
jgi:hypothetical protein